jgi:hypothetical protein
VCADQRVGAIQYADTSPLQGLQQPQPRLDPVKRFENI